MVLVRQQKSEGRVMETTKSMEKAWHRAVDRRTPSRGQHLHQGENPYGMVQDANSHR
jgi:hypothetical protein